MATITACSLQNYYAKNGGGAGRAELLAKNVRGLCLYIFRCPTPPLLKYLHIIIIFQEYFLYNLNIVNALLFSLLTQFAFAIFFKTLNTY